MVGVGDRMAWEPVNTYRVGCKLKSCEVQRLMEAMIKCRKQSIPGLECIVWVKFGETYTVVLNE